MLYWSDDAPQTGKRNVNLYKNSTSENVASNEMFHRDERAPSFIFKQNKVKNSQTCSYEKRLRSDRSGSAS